MFQPHLQHRRLALLILALIGGSALFFVFRQDSGELSGPAVAPQELEQAVRDYVLSLDSYTTYTDPVYGFSFPHPKDFTIHRSQEEAASVAVLEHSPLKMGIRIRVSEDRPARLDKQSLAREFPSVPMEDVGESFLQDGTPTVMFASRDHTNGQTRELWFIRGEQLYRFSLWSPNEEWLDAWVRQLANHLTF